MLKFKIKEDCQRNGNCPKWSTYALYINKEGKTLGWAKSCAFWNQKTDMPCPVVASYYQHYKKILYFSTLKEAKTHFERWFYASRRAAAMHYEELKASGSTDIPNAVVHFDEAYKQILEEEKAEHEANNRPPMPIKWRSKK